MLRDMEKYPTKKDERKTQQISLGVAKQLTEGRD